MGVSIGATSVESPDQVSTVCIPPEYADLAIAFCKKKATCASQESRVPIVTGGDIGYGDKFHGTSETGVHSALHFTRLLEFLFCEKKERGLRPCID
jgi:hypothetical protein